MTRKIASTALILALLFENLIFLEKTGIGYLFFWLASLLGTLYLLQGAERLKPDRLWMFLPSLLLAFAVFRYDAFVVRTYGAMVCLLALAWAVAWNLIAEWRPDVLARLFPSGSWNPARVVENAREGLKLECRWERETVVQVTRGLLLAAGLLAVFGTLLASADAVFGAKISEMFESLAFLSPFPLVRIALWLALLAGGIRLWLTAPPAEPPIARSVFAPTELYIALGSVNALFIAFLVIQVRYLFGDGSLVEALGLNHATYARRGFFELSICIALILPLVLVAYRAAEVNRDSRLRALGGALILSASGLAVSALKRMFLYISVYGLSVERFYAAAGIVVAMTVLAWAAFACVTPRPVGWLLARQNVTVVILLSLLAQVDVDSLVARSHLGLVAAGTRSIDAGYLGATLSADALDVMNSYESRLTGQSLTLLKVAENDILQRNASSEGPGFNFSRWQASRPAPTR